MAQEPEALVWHLYVKKIAPGMTQEQIAAKTGVNQTTAGRWLKGAKIPTDAAKVAAFARGFDRNVLEAFIAARMLTIDEAGSGLPALSRRLLREVQWEAAGQIIGDDADEAPEDREDFAWSDDPEFQAEIDADEAEAARAVTALDQAARRTRPARTRTERQQMDNEAARRVDGDAGA